MPYPYLSRLSLSPLGVMKLTTILYSILILSLFLVLPYRRLVFPGKGTKEMQQAGEQIVNGYI